MSGGVRLTAIDRKNILKAAEQLCKSVHFSQSEVVQLLMKYHEMTSDRIDRVKFRDLLHDHFDMSDDFFMDRVFRAFDKDSDSFLSQEEWVRGMSIFLRGSLEEKIEYCFNIYDLNNDGYISREEMFQMLKTTVRPTGEEELEDYVKDLVEITIKMMDKDSKLSLEDYRTAVQKERLLIEAFGPCLPPRQKLEEFSDSLFNSSTTTSLP
ncbi:EF-hand calcium-binding domain-containing protein 1 [Geodia barretti]|uniref:EF-hand calcium-binding domain-containing protein 1 n=1 Tax=Geodia barretti TaxID=519541 RepID=A0AA35U1F7_GEOBA|nr:EF-hand calcium-binding domain-containing protein 1 [Geodia barretti]